MAIYEFEGKRPKIGKTSFVFKEATIIGDVTIGEECLVCPGVVLRADYGSIVIGDRTSVQDNVVIHSRDGGKTEIGSNVQLGHGAVLHNCKVYDNAVVGLGARLCDFSIVGDWAIVGEGAVVRGKIDDETVVAGVPAKFIRAVTQKDKDDWQPYKDQYADLAARRFPKGLKKLKS